MCEALKEIMKEDFEKAEARGVEKNAIDNIKSLMETTFATERLRYCAIGTVEISARCVFISHIAERQHAKADANAFHQSEQADAIFKVSIIGIDFRVSFLEVSHLSRSTHIKNHGQ